MAALLVSQASTSLLLPLSGHACPFDESLLEVPPWTHPAGTSEFIAESIKLALGYLLEA